MLTFTMTNGVVVTFRTSGTEPKIKFYSELKTQANTALGNLVLRTLLPLLLLTPHYPPPSKGGACGGGQAAAQPSAYHGQRAHAAREVRPRAEEGRLREGQREEGVNEGCVDRRVVSQQEC